MQTTNQSVLFYALAGIVLHQPPPVALVARRNALDGSVRHCLTLPVPFTQAAPWMLIPGQRYDWALMPVEDDPLYRDERGFPLPGSVRKQLRSVRHIRFDDLWIAHEVEPGRLKSGQALAVDDLLPAGYGQPKARPSALPLLAALAGLAMVAAAVAVRDPILFGVNIEGDVADLFYLAHWGYE